MPQQPQGPNHTVSTRFDADTLARLDEVAGSQNRPRSDIIKEAVAGYLEANAWLHMAVAQGQDDLKQGRRISHEHLKKKYGSMGIDLD